MIEIRIPAPQITVEMAGPCPFCGSKRLVVDRDERPYEFWVQCRNDKCLACGPNGETPNLAIRKWNKASKDQLMKIFLVAKETPPAGDDD